MLVKLGDIWIDPVKVEAIEFDEGRMKISTDNNQYRQHINFESINDCAATVNAALFTQSFGGESDEERNTPA